MFTWIDLGTAFLTGVFFVLVVIVVYYGNEPPHPRG